MSLKRPNPFLSKWAENGKRFDVPNDSADHANGYADIQTGFPEITMRSVLNGGVPPWGQDHNGILYRLSEVNQWTQAGGLPVFDQALCDKIGGYPSGTLLQGDDPNRPWVLWTNLIDGNTNNPNELKINDSSEQNGWRRYPVIEAKDGATLRYNDVGELMIFTATSQYQLFVSWTKGRDWDKDYTGTRLKPFKTIDRALSVAPDVGNITIFILDEDTHPWIGMYNYNAETGESNLTKLPGTFYLSSNGLKEKPAELAAGRISIGSKTVTVTPFCWVEPTGDPNEDLNSRDKWFQLQNEFQNLANDGGWAFNVSESDLNSLGLKRPKILLCWEYGNTIVNGSWCSTYVKWVGLARGTNSGSIALQAIDFYINRLDLLNEVKSYQDTNNETNYVYNNIGWAQPSYDITFDGCRIIDQCNNGYSYMFGGLGNPECRLTFSKANFFPDINNITNNKNMKTIKASGQLSITASPDSESSWYMKELNLQIMDSNVEQYFSYKSVFEEPSLNTIKEPLKRYAFMNATFPIYK